MQRTKWLAAGMLAVLLASAAPAVIADPVVKIGYVNTERIMRESTAAKAAEERLSREFAPRGKELQAMNAKLKAAADQFEKDGPVLTDAQRAQRQRALQEMDIEFQRKRREFQDDLNQRKNEELQALLGNAQRVVRQIAQQQKYDVILQDAVYVNPRIDITDQVLKALDQNGH